MLPQSGSDVRLIELVTGETTGIFKRIFRLRRQSLPRVDDAARLIRQRVLEVGREKEKKIFTELKIKRVNDIS